MCAPMPAPRRYEALPFIFSISIWPTHARTHIAIRCLCVCVCLCICAIFRAAFKWRPRSRPELWLKYVPLWIMCLHKLSVQELIIFYAGLRLWPLYTTRLNTGPLDSSPLCSTLLHSTPVHFSSALFCIVQCCPVLSIRYQSSDILIVWHGL